MAKLALRRSRLSRSGARSAARSDKQSDARSDVQSDARSDATSERLRDVMLTLRDVTLARLLPYVFREPGGRITKSSSHGCAYLEAYTKEKLYIIAGSEFGDCQGHVLVIIKALYGLRTSGARFHEKFADTLSAMGFLPCKADPDVWMKIVGLTMNMSVSGLMTLL